MKKPIIIKSKVKSQKAIQRAVCGRWPLVSVLLFLTLCLCVSVVNIHAQSTEFTYQGRLLDNALPPTANYDFEFSLWDSLVAGSQQGTTQTVAGVAVANGIFTVRLNFGAQFSGPPRFLQIAMRPAGGGAYTTLAPRQPITSAPYAVKAITSDTAATALTASNATNLGGVAANNYLLNNGDGSQLINVGGTFKWSVITGNQQALPNNGYFVNSQQSPTEISVNLPINPQIGDVVRISGNTDWRLTQNIGQFVTRETGLFSTNTPWINRFTGNLRAVVCNSSCSKMVASFDDNTIRTSNDYGFTWTIRTTLPGPILQFASSADGTKIVGIRGGPIYTSADSGVTWTPRDTARGWLSVASSADGTKLVAVVFGGQIYTSTDSGVTWTPREINRQWWSVGSSADGTKLVACVLSGLIYTSTDSGVTWTPRATSQGWEGVVSSSDGTKLAAKCEACGAGIYVSSDSGVTWTFRSYGLTSGDTFVSGGSSVQLQMSSTGKDLIVGSATSMFIGSNSSRALFSSDFGLTWTLGPAVTGSLFDYLTASSDLRFIYSLNFNSGLQVNPRLETTKPGTLGSIFGGSGNYLDLLYLGNGEFITTSSRGNVKFQ